ncbi:hypothetical protein Zmor_018919 [Zophobas morio]|nr:hypothetical protein Zmor_018919 [Zophobas morio]
MKKLFIFLVTVFVTAADDAAVQKFTTANNLFARSVYKEIAQGKQGNFLVSPFSAETVLAFAQSGCKDESAEEIRKALHLPNDKDKVESAFKTLLPKFKSNDLYSLHTANKMYVKNKFAIKDEFKTSANLVYQAESESVDFTKSVEAAKSMNDWVEKHTNNKIKDLIESKDLDEDTRVVLINALYFQANWSTPFPLSLTGKRNFYKTSTDSEEVDMLQHFDKYFKYYECPHLKAQFLELPFKGDEASMVIVLPNEKDGLASLENQLDQVFSPQHELKKTFLNVVLPKFRIETFINFVPILQKLGVNQVFDPKKADLSGLAGNKGDLVFDKVAQKTFIDVSEEGVEAAAATFVLIAVPVSAPLHSPKNFIADHPFIFYIKVKDIIVFAGRVTDPSKA